MENCYSNQVQSTEKIFDLIINMNAFFFFYFPAQQIKVGKIEKSCISKWSFIPGRSSLNPLVTEMIKGKDCKSEWNTHLKGWKPKVNSDSWKIERVLSLFAILQTCPKAFLWQTIIYFYIFMFDSANRLFFQLFGECFILSFERIN